MDNQNVTKKVTDFLDGLTSDEIKSIYEPTSEEETTFSVPFFLEEDEMAEDANGNQTKRIVRVDAILQGTIKRTCYVAYAKYQYHAWVTLNGQPYTVDEISAKMNSGNGFFTKTANNVSSLKKLDEVYEYGNACRSAYMLAKARKGNASGAVEVRLK